MDKSQGFTFVFENLNELEKKSQKEAKLDDVLAVRRGQNHLLPMGVIEAEEKALKKRIASMEDPLSSLRQNLNSLTKAHAKLRFLLQEIDSLTKKTSK